MLIAKIICLKERLKQETEQILPKNECQEKLLMDIELENLLINLDQNMENDDLIDFEMLIIIDKWDKMMVNIEHGM